MKPSERFSDRELKALLRDLREDVAAPADFRARVLGRLRAEGLLAAPAAVQPAWTERLRAWLTPARLGFGLAAAAAVAVVLLIQPASAPQPAAPAPAQAQLAPRPAAPAAQRRAPQPVLAARPRPHAAQPAEAPAAPATVELSSRPQAAPAAAQGRSEDLPLQQGLQVADVVAKPTVIVVQPTVTPLSKALSAASEVRNNVVRASRGEAALLLFNLEQAGHVRVEIYDRSGHRVSVLADRDYSAGQQSLRWTGSADEGGMAASGIYELRLEAPGLEARHKVVLVK